jgi:hypothetical protein
VLWSSLTSFLLCGSAGRGTEQRVTLGLIGTGNINGQHQEAFLREGRTHHGGLRSGDRAAAGGTPHQSGYGDKACAD